MNEAGIRWYEKYLVLIIVAELRGHSGPDGIQWMAREREGEITCAPSTFGRFIPSPKDLQSEDSSEEIRRFVFFFGIFLN